MDPTLDLPKVSIAAPDGRLLRYSRYLSPDGTSVRHGAFVESFPNGQPASQGQYAHGQETGLWRDFYASGQVAAEGPYVEGKESGWWRFWDETGREEPTAFFRDGVETTPDH